MVFYFFVIELQKKGVIMKVSAITNYQIQPQKINGTKKHAYSNHAQQNVQPSFKSGKGAFWGGLAAAAYGLAVIAISATGVGAPIGAGMIALTAGGYGLAGATIGDALTGGNSNNVENNDQSHLHVH
jgi:hypothetical protein